MARKYDVLLALARRSATDAARPAALRGAARAWPGALREAELAGPETCARRRRAAHAGVSRPAATRSRWRDDADALAVVLWADLHALLGDQLAFRQGRVRPDVDGFVGWLRGPARDRWPTAADLVAIGGTKLRPRQAYLWLASRAGMKLPALNRCLFARSGHWDHRDSDPEWARIG